MDERNAERQTARPEPVSPPEPPAQTASAIAERMKPDVDRLSAQGRIVAAEVVTEEHYRQADAFLGALKDYADKIETALGPIRDAQCRAHKATCAVIKERTGPLDKTWDIVSRAMAEFKKRERVRIEEARVKALESSKKLDEEQRLAAAEYYEKQGAPDVAQMILNQEQALAVPDIPEVQGDRVHFREGRWRGVIVNKLAFVLAVKAHPELLNALDIKQRWLDDQAQQMNGDLSKYPGVVTKKEDDKAVVR